MQHKSKNNIVLIKTLGDVIRARRELTKKSIYKISAEISMSKSTWREAELGVCKDINLTTFWKIAEGLDVTPAQLLQEVQDKLEKDFSLVESD